MYKTVQISLTLLHRTVLLAAVLVVGTVIFMKIEDINYKDAGHFCWTVVSTIGYGKITPKTEWGMIFTILYGLIGIPTTLFTISSYGTMVTHLLKMIIARVESCVCRSKQVSNINAKIFISLCILAIIEIFIGGYAMRSMYGWSYLISVYSWFVTMTTIGFGDYIPGLPKTNFGYTFICLVCNLVSLVTIASLIETLQAMLSTVDNDKRSTCAKFCCCYKDDEKDIYDVQNKTSSILNLELPKE